MPLLARLRYSLYLAIALSMIVSLIIVLTSADAIAILPSSAFDWALSPGLFLIAYVISFIAVSYTHLTLPTKRIV